MNSLSTAFASAGYTVRTSGDVIFVDGWGIFCSMIGNIQARNVRDQQERFHIGAINEPVDHLVEYFAEGLSALYPFSVTPSC